MVCACLAAPPCRHTPRRAHCRTLHHRVPPRCVLGKAEMEEMEMEEMEMESTSHQPVESTSHQPMRQNMVHGGATISRSTGVKVEETRRSLMVIDECTTSRSSMSRMTRSNPRPTSDEPPLTEYEKVRARNMMRNNRIFQSLGIDAIASMIRKTNDVQQGITNGVQEGSGVISDDREYNPKEDEVVVHKTVKALKESRTKRPGLKKTASKNRKSLEASSAMPPGRVMAPPPGQTKRILEPDEPHRVTRQKATMAAATDHQESPLGMDFESSVEMCDEFSPMDEETTLSMDESGTVCVPLRRGAPSIDRNDVVSEEEQQLVLQPHKFTFSFTNAMTNKHRLRKGKGLERITKALGTKANFEINTDSETIKYACKDVLRKISKNRCHNIKKKYFDTVAANKVSTKSPVPDLTDGEWQALVQMWSTPRHKKEERKGEELSAIDLFKATHNSKKHGFSEPVKIAISDAEIVEEVLKTEVNQSTLLRNVGLKSSSNNSGKGTNVVAAHVRDLQEKLERSELQAEVMQEEMAAIKLKAEEYEAARDKELELLRKKSQEQEEKLAHLMALFGAKAL
ncbi:hypothetical protein D1007_53317 [Hordeum vulgare]|nr:hypothetical protein D1007_53317 [Hordeum vulgare]